MSIGVRGLAKSGVYYLYDKPGVLKLTPGDYPGKGLL